MSYLSIDSSIMPIESRSFQDDADRGGFFNGGKLLYVPLSFNENISQRDLETENVRLCESVEKTS